MWPSTDDPAVEGSIEYYKKKVAELEKEREDLVKKVADIQLEYQKFHDQEWELRRREDEIDSLKKALADAQLHIFDEREHSMHLQHQNDALKIQEMEDRKKIRDLLALTQPVTQEVTYFKDCRPDQVTKYMLNTKTNKVVVSDPKKDNKDICMEEYIKSAGDSKNSSTKFTKVKPKVCSNNNPQNHQQQPSRILRTIIMPNEKTDTLLLQVESLQARLEEHVKLSKEKEEALLKERQILMEEEEKRRERDRQTIMKLQRDYEEAHKKLQVCNREYFVTSHNLKLELRKQGETIDKLSQENLFLRKQIEKLKERSQEEARLLINNAREQTEEYARYFREQTIMKENDIMHLQDQLAAKKEEYNLKMKQMELSMQKLQKKYKDLAKRRNLDIEGFNNDVLLLRRKLLSLQRKVKQKEKH
ncbi:hypothetical protein FDP41_011521 [Naegleria fowleri]|uniref:Uncharacterized protein n=1 Tax=Naegleria fowleri TaxID=5763 RepID=A0A6A5C683_NAEFO|nr:uncharacterized protein FDP41_011521 [Naegleria fowleri]KAF0982591.1 hypothetical protein FDP41_011521 [Naegleria fowleri]